MISIELIDLTILTIASVATTAIFIKFFHADLTRPFRQV